jgi:hypothetical protein
MPGPGHLAEARLNRPQICSHANAHHILELHYNVTLYYTLHESGI